LRSNFHPIPGLPLSLLFDLQNRIIIWYKKTWNARFGYASNPPGTSKSAACDHAALYSVVSCGLSCGMGAAYRDVKNALPDLVSDLHIQVSGGCDRPASHLAAMQPLWLYRLGKLFESKPIGTSSVSSSPQGRSECREEYPGSVPCRLGR